MDWAQDQGRADPRPQTASSIVHSETNGHAAVDFGGADARGCRHGRRRPRRDLVHASDVEMIAAYFAPTWAMLRRIARVGGRGPRADHHRRQVGQSATIAAARFTYNRLLKRGVEIFEYHPTKLAFEAGRDRRHRPHRLVQLRHPQPLPQPRDDAARRRSRVRRADAALFRGRDRRQPADHAEAPSPSARRWPTGSNGRCPSSSSPAPITP